ncbi:transcriptional regulator [Streptacidiphilus pinicola]|uniref:Transcriptional regulator n=1 Tax=Streptacidiphilus pinicola TaxID=2219663 RepID=A0A2X0IVT3_9ACTN|nr:helix-turn-helix transcriptional regulator [Streptacidiphilus pinicola]RAG81766.1 transcriptional regulator [Streptacidiphilus pinicola]
MPPRNPDTVGARIAAARRLKRLDQAELAAAAHVSTSTIKKIEQGSRRPSDQVLEAVADALDVDPEQLLGTASLTSSRVHATIPTLRAAIDAYDLPDDGPIRSLRELRDATAGLEHKRLDSQYAQITRTLPDLLAELSRAVHTLQGAERQQAAALLASAYRSADAVVYKFRYHDLSVRLIELMRWAAHQAEDPALDATAAYVRMETFFAAGQPQSLATGLRTLEAAIDAAPANASRHVTAAVGALHMRAAVAAGRVRDEDRAHTHLAGADRCARRVPEGVYAGTAFGPDSFHIHQVAVAVELGNATTVLNAARTWKPPAWLPAERRSHFYIDIARAQLWQNLQDDAFESLQVARRIAPQHVREHGQVHQTLKSLLRTKRSDRDSLIGFAEWAHVV